MRALRFLTSFDQDLEELWYHIARDNSPAADHVVAMIRDRCTILAEHPRAGPARLDLADDCRHLVCGNHLVLYRVLPDRVELVRVLDGRRRLSPDMLAH